MRDGSEAHYRRLCPAAGVLPGAGRMTAPHGLPRRADGSADAYVRLFLGRPGPVLDEALDRPARAGLGW